MPRLTVHPDTPAKTSLQVEASTERLGDNLHIRFAIDGDIAAIRLPPSIGGVRTDGLWRTTCFEAFVRPSGEGGYLEHNFSTSRDWAAYEFAGYRQGMTEPDVDPPLFSMAMTPTRFVLETAVWIPPVAVELGLSAVIDEADGTKSYWALRHPPGKPDFHHPDCFALELPAPERP